MKISLAIALTLATLLQIGLGVDNNLFRYGACYYNNGTAVVSANSSPIEYCPTFPVNRVSLHCREHWMRKLMDEIFRHHDKTNQHHCPIVFDGSLMVDHSDSSTTNYKDTLGVNCGKLVSLVVGKLDLGWTRGDAPVTELIRMIGERILPAASNRNRSMWNKYSQYSILEPSPSASGVQVQVGIKEVIYGVRTSELLEYNYPNLLAMPAIELARRQVNFNMQAPLVYIPHVLHTEIVPLVRWQYNTTVTCPPRCDSFTHAPRCRTA